MLASKKILYLIHVPWDWVKQRPHFLAEELGRDQEVLICYPRFVRTKDSTPNRTSLKRVGIYRLPFSRFRRVRKLNEAITRYYYARLCNAFRPDLVWVTYPGLYPLLPRTAVDRCRIVYDCMDDVLEFPGVGDGMGELLGAERALLDASAVVFASSQHLAEKLIDRGCDPERVKLVRNAFGGEVLPLEGCRKAGANKDVFRICYFGTISEWLDFEAILYVLGKLTSVEFHFFGPGRGHAIEHPGIYFHGPVRHEELFDKVRNFDCFIMPFKVNELIKSVDPVKLYEYINLGKNIISSRYEEIQRFEPFVHFYEDKYEFLDIVRTLAVRNALKYSQQERTAFLDDNNWEQRGRTVRESLQAIDF